LSGRKGWRYLLRNNRSIWHGFERDNRASALEISIGAENQSLITPISRDVSILFSARVFHCREEPTSFSLENLQFFCRLTLPGGGTLKFQICSVAVDQSCPMVVH